MSNTRVGATLFNSLSPPAHLTGTIDGMNAAIVVLLILLATGVVVAPLIRLRAYLKNSMPAQEFQAPPPDDEPQ
jgi:hypothetical protein